MRCCETSFRKGRPPLTFWKSEKENPQALDAVANYRRANPSEAGPISDDILHQRLFLPMVDEAVRCLHDKIVEHPWQVDFALTYGIGSPRVPWWPSHLGSGNHDARTRSPGTGVDGDQVWQTLEPCPALSNGGW